MRDREKGIICVRAAIVAAALSLTLGACSVSQTKGTETAGQEVSGEEGAGGQPLGQKMPGEEGADKQSSGQTPGTEKPSGQKPSGQKPSGQKPPEQKPPEQKPPGQEWDAAGSSAQENGAQADAGPVLVLSLPEDERLCSNPVRSQDDKMIQILFHDESTQSDAIARASLDSEDSLSEYYVLDEAGAEKRRVPAEDGSEMEMDIRKTVENSDIHGILIRWEYKGIFYELWEDDAREQADDVIRMAAGIAVSTMEEGGAADEESKAEPQA